MIEDYGTLSEEELLEELREEIEENTEIDASELEFKFEDGKLHIFGTLQNEEELENLVGVLENHIEPEDYEFEVDLVEGQAPSKIEKDEFSSGEEEEGSENGKILEESLEDIDDDEIDFVDDEGFDEDKW